MKSLLQYYYQYGSLLLIQVFLIRQVESSFLPPCADIITAFSRFQQSFLSNDMNNYMNAKHSNIQRLRFKESLSLTSPSSSSLLSMSSSVSNDMNQPKKTKNKNKKKKKKSPTIKWIACTSKKEVNRAIEIYIKKGDTVAELGSQLRETSTTICETIIGSDSSSSNDNKKSGKAYLVDIERKYPNTTLKRRQEDRMTAMRREGDDIDFYNGVAEFIEIQSFDDWRHALFFRQHGNNAVSCNYNALVLDVSTIAGNDLELTCISLVREFIALNKNYNNNDSDEHDNPCRVVIIKSGSLHQLARRLFHAQRLFADVVSLSDNPYQTSIIGTVGVEEYRRTIPYAVRKGDVVLEVGSHFGTSTAIIHDAARIHNDDDNDDESASENDGVISSGCLGVDVGANIIASAKKKFPQVPFEVGDAWKMLDLINMKEKYFANHLPSSLNQYYDVVYVDVGGLSGSEGLLEALALLGSITNCLQPRCIVIKSLCIRRLSSSLVPFSQVWKEIKTKQK